VQDGVEAMLVATREARDGVHVFNVGSDDYCCVDDSIGWMCEHLGLAPERAYAGGRRGWVGDSPFILLDCARLRGLGWKPTLGIRDGVIRTVEYLRANEWLIERRTR
jgi:UDP-glucose 4-epimerase